MADISALTATVRLRGLWRLKLACWVGKRRLIPVHWRVFFVNEALRRLGCQVNDGPTEVFWTKSGMRYIDVPGKTPPTPAPDTDTGRDT